MDDWDDNTVTNLPVTTVGVAAEGGRKFSSGRGFKAVQDDIETDWGSGNTGNIKFSYFYFFTVVLMGYIFIYENLCLIDGISLFYHGPGDSRKRYSESSKF